MSKKNLGALVLLLTLLRSWVAHDHTHHPPPLSRPPRRATRRLANGPDLCPIPTSGRYLLACTAQLLRPDVVVVMTVRPWWRDGPLIDLPGALVRVGLPLGSGVFGGGQKTVQPAGLIGCWGQGIGFSPQVLTSAQAAAETADTGPAAALRADLGQEPDMPASGWVIVSESDSQVMFIAREPTIADARYAEVTVQRGTSLSGAVGADGWQVAGSGGCQLMAVPPSGYTTGTWSLDPSVAYSATATELSIDVSELACSSGTSPEGRIVTSVDYGQTSVAVTVFVRSLSGAQTCQLTISATPEPPYVVHLDQPVESRDLVDGGTWPPPQPSMWKAWMVRPASTLIVASTERHSLRPSVCKAT